MSHLLENVTSRRVIMEKGVVVGNGGCFTRTGHRAVVLSPEGEVRPVLTANRSGLLTSRGTKQVCQPGDLMFWQQWGSGTNEEGVDVLGAEGELTPLEINAQVAAWKLLPDVLKLWLDAEGEGRQESYLPDGCGWEGGMTLSDRAKERRVRGLFEGCPASWLERTVSVARTSPGKGLMFDWRDAGLLPQVMENECRHWDGSVVGIHSYNEWVCWDAKGVATVVRPDATSGEWGSNYAHSETGVYDGEPTPMPEGTVRAVKIRWGAYTKKHFTYGVTWELFTR